MEIAMGNARAHRHIHTHTYTGIRAFVWISINGPGIHLFSHGYLLCNSYVQTSSVTFEIRNLKTFKPNF